MVDISTIITALISAGAALTSAMFAAKSKARSEDFGRLERAQNQLQERIELVQRDIGGLHNSFPSRREFDIYTDMLREVREDIRALGKDMRDGTNMIVKALKSLRGIDE